MKKTIKEFAEDIGLDKKQLQNRLAYWRKKGANTWNFSDTFSDGVRYLSEDEQKAVCELLGLPVFDLNSDAFSDGFRRQSDTQNSEIDLLRSQISDLKSDKKFLQKQLSNTDQRDSEMRILLKQYQDFSAELQLKIKQMENQKSELISEISDTFSDTCKPNKNNVPDTFLEQKSDGVSDTKFRFIEKYKYQDKNAAFVFFDHLRSGASLKMAYFSARQHKHRKNRQL